MSSIRIFRSTSPLSVKSLSNRKRPGPSNSGDRMVRSPLLITIFLTACAPAPDQTQAVDLQIASEIARIKAIDNHAHPVRPTAAGEKPDDEYDALPVDNLEAQSDPLRQRAGSKEVIDARQQLFGNDKAGAIRAHGLDYATWILD